MIYLYWILGYLVIGIGFAIAHVVSAIMVYPLAATGNWRNALSHIPYFWEKVAFTVIFWILIPFGWIYCTIMASRK